MQMTDKGIAGRSERPAASMTWRAADLDDALTAVAVGIAEEPSRPELGGVLFSVPEGAQFCTAQTTDDVTAASASIDLIEGWGELLIDWGRLRAALARAEQQPGFDWDSANVTITAAERFGASVKIDGDARRRKVRGWDLDSDTVRRFEGTPPPIATLACGDLAHLVKAVVPAASSDDTLPMFTAVCFTVGDETLSAVALDRYRLGAGKVDAYTVDIARAVDGLLVPGALLRKLAPVLGDGEVAIGCSPRADASSGAGRYVRGVSFSFGRVTVWTDTIDHRFPASWPRLVPTGDGVAVTVPDAAVLAAAVTRAADAAAEAGDSLRRVALRVEGGVFTVGGFVAGQREMVGAESAAATIEDPPWAAVQTVFDPGYLADALAPFSGGVTVHLRPAGQGTAFLAPGEKLRADAPLLQIVTPYQV